MSEIDGKTNIRYLHMNMEDDDYEDAVAHYLAMHMAKDANNKLTVLPNIEETESIVKVVAHVGWIAEEQTAMDDGIESGLYINIYDYEDLPAVLALLRSVAWPQPDEDDEEEEEINGDNINQLPGWPDDEDPFEFPLPP